MYFRTLGVHHFHILNGPLTAEFEVTVKYVRRELRDLTDADRDRYFEALHTVYATEQAEGVAKYGRNFKSAAWLVRDGSLEKGKLGLVENGFESDVVVCEGRNLLRELSVEFA